MRSILLYSEINLKLVLEIAQDQDHWIFTIASIGIIIDSIVHIIDIIYDISK